jgi:hypothetical protein
VAAMAAVSAAAAAPVDGGVYPSTFSASLLELHAARRSPDNIRTAPMRINAPFRVMWTPSPPLFPWLPVVPLVRDDDTLVGDRGRGSVLRT